MSAPNKSEVGDLFAYLGERLLTRSVAKVTAYVDEGERIIGAPTSWQGDPLRCSTCGQLIERHTHKVTLAKGKPEERTIEVPSVGCRCERRPTLVRHETGAG
jgi:hypothetical protein